MKLCVVFLLLVVFLFPFHLGAQTKLSRREYIELYKEIAIREMHRGGIPASITLAQACLESENGNSRLAREANNHFGIKCKTDWNGGKAFHDDDDKNECFRKYSEVIDSYIDHTDFLKLNKRYAFLFDIGQTDYEAWAKGLKAAGYATNPQYPELLIKIITDEGLHQYDKLKPGDLPEGGLVAERQKQAVEHTVRRNNQKSFGEFYISVGASGSQREIGTMNGLDMITVEEGDTYASIAEQLEMKEWLIRSYNDLDKDSPEPTAGEKLYIERKHWVAEKGKDTHRVRAGESMWSISQQYGIKLSRLYKLNRMNYDQVPMVGQQLSLRKKVEKKKDS